MDQGTTELQRLIGQQIEIKRSVIPNEHGLCDAAETHWAIYLIKLIENKVVPTIHTFESSGKSVSYLVKGEELSDSGFTFGADSMLVVDSKDPLLENLILIQEDIGIFVGREANELHQSLETNGYFNDSIQSRWKEVVREYLQKHNIDATDLTLERLISDELRENDLNIQKAYAKSRNILENV